MNLKRILHISLGVLTSAAGLLGVLKGIPQLTWVPVVTGLVTSAIHVFAPSPPTPPKP